MANENENETYPLGRDSKESARLNVQNEFLIELIGTSPIHASIPENEIKCVADVATGTGIWLQDVATHFQTTKSKEKSESMCQSPCSSSRSRSTASEDTDTDTDTDEDEEYYYHGFDISPTQFIKYDTTNTVSPINLSVHNILDPFPEEHIGRYDLVHVRLLVMGLKVENYEAAIRNILGLLKPGGYMQWEDIDTTSYSTAPTETEPACVTEMRRLITHAVNALGMSPAAPAVIQREAVEAGFEDVRRDVYSTVSRREKLRDRAREWLVRAARCALPVSMARAGIIGEDEAKELTEGLLRELEMGWGDAVPVVNLQVVVGRRPLLE